MRDCKLGVFQDSFFWRRLLCVFTPQTFVPYFLDVQEANSRVSQQWRVRNNFFGRLFENGIYTPLQSWACVTETFWFPMVREIVRHSIDHVSFDMVDHVPSDIPESSFPGRLDIFLDNEAVTHMIIKGRSPLFETRVTNSPC